MKKNKIILSTFGPLHLIKSAEYLSKHVDIRVIQGWIPTWWNKWLLKFISLYIGYDLSRTIKKRMPECLKNRNIGLAFPEFLNCFCQFFVKSDFIREKCNVYSIKLYGKLSCAYINNADILHVRSGSGRGGAIQRAHKKGMKVIVDHSIAHPLFMEKQLKEEYDRFNLPFGLSLQTPLWQEVMNDCNEADIILVNSHFVKETFANAGYDEDKIKIVYLGVREDFFKLKKNYQIQKKLRILFTGGFGIRKGAEYILKALQKLDQLGIDYEFIIVGDNTEAKVLIDKYPSKHLKLIGMVPQDDLKHYLSTSDIYLFPSLCEGCASSGMEAMAAGLPVIATKESGLPITHKRTGLIIPSKDVDAIVQSILLLNNEIKLRENIGKESYHYICNNYTWDKYAEQVKLIYQKMLNQE